jgi:hypothetical protein
MNMDSSYSAVMGKLHFLVYGETRDYEPVDTSRYLAEMESAFMDVPAFKSLFEKYKLEDLSTNENKLTPEDLSTKYLYLYIFFELMYDRLKNSKEEKDKLYSRISDIGADNNLFGYLKIYTVYYGTRVTKWFDSPLLLRLLCSNFLMLNIAEAVVDDAVQLQLANAFVGLYLALSVPVSVNNFRKDEHDNVLCNFTTKWVDLYTSWNSRFTYSDSPGADYFPRTSRCLLGSKAHGGNTDDDDPDHNAWLNFRAYALFASHLLKSQKEFNAMFGLLDAPNKDILRDWDKENVAHVFNRKT